MADNFHTLFLLALPGSGKSEVRNYLTHKDPAQFHMGPTVQIDDYPYVHLQLVVDEALKAIGEPLAFHGVDPGGQRNGPFFSAYELGGLMHLLNEDYLEILSGKAHMPENPARHLLDRFDAASVMAGAPAKFVDRSPEVMAKVEAAIADEVRVFYEEKAANVPADLNGKTIVIEFARGGPATEAFPLKEGYGYLGTLSEAAPEMLEHAAILYIWVTPEESRRKNVERVVPGEEASILFHGTPESVMDQEYGMCDMAWLMESSDESGTIRIESQGSAFHIPVERFDNRMDLTTFLRSDAAEWTDADIDAIHAPIKDACVKLWATYAKNKSRTRAVLLSQKPHRRAPVWLSAFYVGALPR